VSIVLDSDTQRDNSRIGLRAAANIPTRVDNILSKVANIPIKAVNILNKAASTAIGPLNRTTPPMMVLPIAAKRDHHVDRSNHTKAEAQVTLAVAPVIPVVTAGVDNGLAVVRNERTSDRLLINAASEWIADAKLEHPKVKNKD
jgi:hypothetical protein